ncbi:MAG: gamma-glutamyltransferase family protein [Actinobacteria bacterium]|nr:MAG: gamma-glutamyltransferase family protein [Actinomycetota bacterium]
MRFTTRPELRGTFGMVASTHWLGSAAGMAVLERGGNAFDAAVATGFVLQIVEPHLNGPAGDLPAIVYSADRDEVLVVCGQGTSPAAATIERFRELDLDLIPGTGLLPAVVPGAFDGWLLMLREFGTWRLADVLELAIGYAEQGFPVVPAISRTVAGVEQIFREEWTTSADVFLRDGVPQAGTLFRNPDTAATYARIVDESRGGTRERELERARALWYEGFVADAIDRFARSEAMDTSGVRHAGLLTGDDLASWRATLEQPTSRDYRGHTVFKTGPWGQGPVFLQQLALLEGFELAEMDLASAELVHTVVECAKLAFADREAWYGDPDFTEVPLDLLLSKAYADERRALVGEQASADMRPGGPGPRLPSPVDGRVAAGVGEPTRASGDTVHLDVVDRHGNIVSATPSGGWLWSSPVVPGLGFPLGTRAQMFWLEEGLPNSLEPRKRPRTTLSPSLAFRDGDPYLAFGTPGGDQQDQSSLIFFLHHVDFGLDLQAAIDAPSFHTNHFPSSFYPRDAHPRQIEVEGRFEQPAIDDLRARGHDVVVTDDWALGRVTAAARENGLLKAAANPRGMQGYATGR